MGQITVSLAEPKPHLFGSLSRMPTIRPVVLPHPARPSAENRLERQWRDYPDWPGGLPALLFDPVGQVSYNAIQGGGGWRRESYDARALPPDPKEIRRLTSTDVLVRGR